MFDFIKNISPTELIIIVLLLAVLFGGKTIAGRLARTGGKTVKELKNIKKEFTDAIEDDDDKPGSPPASRLGGREAGKSQ